MMVGGVAVSLLPAGTLRASVSVAPPAFERFVAVNAPVDALN